MKKISVILCCFLFLNTFSSFAQKEKISPDFNNFKGVVLFIKPSFKIPTRILESKLEKHYKGAYKILEEGDLKSGDYANVETYPFLIEFIYDGTTNGASIFNFIMTDRIHKKSFKSNSIADNTLPAYAGISKYVKKLEDERSK